MDSDHNTNPDMRIIIIKWSDGILEPVIKFEQETTKEITSQFLLTILEEIFTNNQGILFISLKAAI